jgi:predicted TIM-barrel fold metal-dependent hydrolase
MIVDSHCHIFTRQIIQNVSSNSALVQSIKLDVERAEQRREPEALEQSAAASGVEICLLLPTAAPNKVRAENDRHLGFASEFPRLRTLATLHPVMKDLSGEIRRVFDLGAVGFKLSSFSQRFDLMSREVEDMLCALEKSGSDCGIRPVVVLDTFTRADIHFGAGRDHLTTPAKLAEIARRHSEIDFVGAHMGGLAADPDELLHELTPTANLYLDTSNAAHTLTNGEFIQLLKMHGPYHILFGTDWPWFHHAAEIPKIRSLLEEAGYNESEQEAVFGENARKLFRF